MTSPFYRFAGFELHRDLRALRHRGAEIALQPRVFDVLLYLVDHRQRVVAKDELLEALWPGVIVTESSLQRAVSLARAALEQGGLGAAIRSYARRGYRFCIDEAELQQAGPSTAAATAPVSVSVSDDDPEALFASGHWKAAMAAYAAVDRAAPLTAEALERWATAAQCAGDLAGAVAPLERAAVSYSSRGECEAAARVTISLARIQLESMDAAMAQGCLRRATRLLANVPVGEQHGFLAWMMARLRLCRGELQEAIRHSAEAREIGRKLQSNDIESMGLLMEGIGIQASGDTAAGLALQDEAAAAVLAGNVSPLIGGLVYCGVVSSCANSGDWQRAEEWMDGFIRWCGRNNIDTFAGSCLIHRAEVLANSGRLREARDALQTADPVIRIDAPWALGDSYRLMGDVHLAGGNDDAALECYQRAYETGGDPYPGYALLLHRRGRSEEALRGLLRTAETANWVISERQGRYFAYAAQIAASCGRRDEARALLARLDDQPARFATGASTGLIELARAELHWADGDTEGALRSFRRAIEILLQKRAVMEAATARLRLAEVLIAQDERAAAELEVGAAEAQFLAAEANGYLTRCRALRAQSSGSESKEEGRQPNLLAVP